MDLSVLDLPRKGDRVLFSLERHRVYAHQAFDFLMEQDPRRGLQLLQAMADLALAAQVARKEGIRVPRSEVERLVSLGMKKDLERARRTLGPKATLADFAAQELGMGLGEYKDWLEKIAARQLLLSYTVVYTALKEDRVQCRFMVLPDRDLAERLARSLRAGADFATLARKYSLDPSGARGGEVPPFPRDFDHPVARVAFDLEPGKVSDPIPQEAGGKKVWLLVMVERRIPGKPGKFRDLEEEIRRRIRRSPPSPEEILTFFGTAGKRYGLRLFPGDSTRGAHERGTGTHSPAGGDSRQGRTLPRSAPGNLAPGKGGRDTTSSPPRREP